ncbi:hypothetical protein K9B35_05795 [Sphingomonas sp. R647]|uniref:hypothetical protein n=1 Tax=Sphingomonas sp. R647 TaxID=2875233 RepID=UPI001CD5EA07|nr:hypothetical protein [Sphingomonas sp. R647]MCA1197471.1 hypothetical protein [Sphingomonas sp. R647]
MNDEEEGEQHGGLSRESGHIGNSAARINRVSPARAASGIVTETEHFVIDLKPVGHRGVNEPECPVSSGTVTE